MNLRKNGSFPVLFCDIGKFLSQKHLRNIVLDRRSKAFFHGTGNFLVKEYIEFYGEK